MAASNLSIQLLRKERTILGLSSQSASVIVEGMMQSGWGIKIMSHWDLKYHADLD